MRRDEERSSRLYIRGKRYIDSRSNGVGQSGAVCGLCGNWNERDIKWTKEKKKVGEIKEEEEW